MKLFQGQYLIQIKCFFLISLIILLTGCISPCTEPKAPLEEVILRVADTQAEETVIDFIESYDFRAFLGLNQSDKRVLSEYNDSSAHGRFVQNYTLLLTNTRNHYANHNDLLTGDLFYYITCQNTSQSNYTRFDDTLTDLLSYQNYSRKNFLNLAFKIAAYLPINSSQVVLEEEEERNALSRFPKLLSNMTDFDWYWVALVVLNYEWTCCSYDMGAGCYTGHLHSEVIFLSPTLQLLGVFAFYELHVA